MSDPAPKRRLFRFSLRMLFVVVTVACCWMGYELNWIRQRQAVLAASGVRYFGREFRAIGFHTPDAPWPLALLGEEGFAEIDVPLIAEVGWLDANDYLGGVKKPLTATHREELQRIQMLFPKAEIEHFFY